MTDGLLDNRFGHIETATRDLRLAVGSLLNSGGHVLHVGTGNFGIDLTQLGQAGGSFITNAALDFKAAQWNNASVLQAKRLTLDIGQLTQSGGGQLLASESLAASGSNWVNDGLLASDGTLQLNLDGYAGNGRISSLGELTLNAGTIDLGSSASLAGGAATHLNASQSLTNRGRITAVGALDASAAVLNNYGTLGSALGLRLSAGNLLNDQGLLFSGGDMALRVGTLTNRYADIYSLGGIDIAGDDQGNWAGLVENISGSLESGGNLRVLASTLTNRKDRFTSERQLVSGNINVYWDDVCDGRGCELYFRSVENYQDVIAEDTPAAFITTAGNFDFTGSRFNNLYSSISAGQNISINTAEFNNVGAGGGEEKHLDSGYYTRNDSLYWTFTQNKNLFNVYNDPSSPNYQPGKLTVAQVLDSVGYPNGFFNTTEYSAATSGAVVVPAVIQAAGSISISASQRFDNSVMQANTLGVGGIGARDTSAVSSSSTVVVAVTSQLPPDLAQQQVNPISLPGFSLPSGQNGLFRLSGQVAAEGSVSSGLGGDLTLVGQRPQAPETASASMLDGQSLSIARVQGLPSSVMPSNSHKYLIETNPELTNLQQFLGSDYLLGKLGYDPDQAQKRLGDGLYEQRLIRDAVLARTGQRYLAGMTSDEALFRYLMDNAIAYQDQLQLSLGVALSAEQVAALTHDIVWLEEHEVLGEKVLVPVLYLAQAEGRLAANGALIQGRDLTLISGGELNNQGTLRASGNLVASATNIVNRGLLEASQRLQLLATDSIRNAQAGIIAGRDVTLTALRGDVLNERSVATYTATGGGDRVRDDIVNNAARIEAANSLEITAGRDLLNIGSVITAGGDARLIAGRDLLIGSQSETDTYEYQRRRVSGYDNRITQHGSDIQVGGDLQLSAQRDAVLVASQATAGGDLVLSAGRDIQLASAASEQHQYSNGKKGDTRTIRQLDAVEQQGSELKAGGDLTISAGENLTLIASKVGAGDEAYLVAGDRLELLAAQDSNYSLYQKSKKGSFGSKSFQRDEETQVTNVGSAITSGGDLTLLSGGDQTYQAARLDSGNDLTLVSGGAITFEAVKDLHQESHEKSKGNLAWQSAKGKGTTDETLRQSELIAQGNLVIQAVDGLKIDIKKIDQKTVSQTIDAMVQADPNLAWLKEAEQRGDVDWRKVKEVHDSFKYSNSGLGAGAQLVIAIVVAYFTAGAASGLVASGASAAGASAGGAWAAGTGAWANAAATAALTGMASNTAISTINNRGNLGAVVDDVTASDALRGYAVAGITAGLTNGLYDGWVGTETGTAGAIQNGGKVLAESGLSSLEGIGRFSGNQLLQNGTSTVLDRALGGDSSFSDALRSSLANTFAAAGFNLIGDQTAPEKWDLKDGGLAKIGMHAVMGGLAAEAAGGDFKTGALAAGVNEALVDALAQQYGEMDPEQKKSLLVMNSQVIGVLATAAQGGDEQDLQAGAWVAGSATQYNYTLHEGKAKTAIEEATERCDSDPACPKQGSDIDQGKVLDALRALAAKDEQAVSALDKDTLAFAYYTLRRDPDVRFEVLIPDTVKEQAFDWGTVAFDLFFPTPTGKAGGAVKATEKVSAEVLEALGKKFGDDLANIGAKGIEIAPGKFDYLFGRVASNSHNAARSNQLALEMKRLGVPDNASGRQMLTEHLALSAKAEGNVVSAFSNQFGKFEVRESFFMGPSGKAANFQSTFQVLEDGTRKLSTIIPIH